MHEPPQAPNYWSSEFSVNDDFDIRPGLVFACEPMVTERGETTRELDDGWTIVAKDKGRCAHFEHTIAITKEGPVRLTGPPEGDELELVPEEFRDPSSWYRW
jgi:methionyl aminopeptidase